MTISINNIVDNTSSTHNIIFFLMTQKTKQIPLFTDDELK